MSDAYLFYPKKPNVGPFMKWDSTILAAFNAGFRRGVVRTARNSNYGHSNVLTAYMFGIAKRNERNAT